MGRGQGDKKARERQSGQFLLTFVKQQFLQRLAPFEGFLRGRPEG